MVSYLPWQCRCQTLSFMSAHYSGYASAEAHTPRLVTCEKPGGALCSPAAAGCQAPHSLHEAPAPVQEVGKQHTKAALINDLLFVSTFFVCRLLCGPVVVYWTLRCRSSHRVVKWGGAGIQCVSVFWFYRIVQARRRARMLAPLC